MKTTTIGRHGLGSRTAALLTLLALLALTAPCGAQSLYDEATFQPLTADRRALRAGDSLTVLVFENASATQSAESTTEKSNSINVGASIDTLNIRNVVTAPRNISASVGTGGEVTGKGRIQRSGRLAAQITVTVTAVEPNGELRVAGLQQITINGEKQLLQLAGRVRPGDIGEANTVASTRLADADITYVGDGILAESQRRGVVARFLTWLGLL